MHIKVFYKFSLKLVALTIGNADESLLRWGTLYTAGVEGYKFVHFLEGRLFGDRHRIFVLLLEIKLLETLISMNLSSPNESPLPLVTPPHPPCD